MHWKKQSTIMAEKKQSAKKSKKNLNLKVTEKQDTHLRLWIACSSWSVSAVICAYSAGGFNTSQYFSIASGY